MTRATARCVLVLVDGTALAYRSHFAFAKNPLTTADGTVTSAVYGFITGLRRMKEALSPDELVVVFDPRGPTFRHRLSADYKATRERMPDDLRDQFPRIREYLRLSGVEQVTMDGYEADDVLAALARRAAASDKEVRIVSGDKDLLQEVGEGVRVVIMGRGADRPRTLDEGGVLEAMGVRPEQIVDYLSLVGDSSDNVAGVRGVGKKTAVRLLAEHGTLDAILDHAADMKASKLRENLIADREIALAARELVRLHGEIEPADSDYDHGAANPEALDEFLRLMEFHSLRQELSAPVVAGRSDYRIVDTARALQEAARALREAGRFAFDTETTSKRPMLARLVGLSFASSDGEAWYVPVGHAQGGGVPWETARGILAPILEDAEIPKWGQNVKYDTLVLKRHGVQVRGVDFDTMLASYVEDPSRRSHSLDELADRLLSMRKIPIEEVLGKGKSAVSMADAPVEKVARYAAEDADVTFRLRAVLEPGLNAAGQTELLRDIEMPLAGVLADMEEAGIRLDTDFLVDLSGKMHRELEALVSEIRETAGPDFNPGSPKQVGVLLFEKLGLPTGKKTKTGFSTNASVLEMLRDQHPIPGLLLRHRELAKLKSTYVDSLPGLVHPETGRLHTSFNQAVTVTGRLSSSNPNLQNVPVRTKEGRSIRRAFVPLDSESVLLSADYSQIELRILAHMAQDDTLIQAFREGRDIHRATAALVFDVPEEEVTGEQRGRAKTINFGVLYGMGAGNLAGQLGIARKEAGGFIKAYFQRYPGVDAFIREARERARQDLFVETLSGRRRPVPEIASSDPRLRSFGERIAVNTPIQGTAADIMKIAMVRVATGIREAGLRSRILLTVHDELVFNVPRDEVDALCKVAIPAMEGAMELEVPLLVETGHGQNWSEAH
ncbi:MAG: DNA polymerase I [Gemmatimonadota bacterium]|jgi:DNA polymerase-1|nr:DNA polymerase I [Candidatus Woesearchaeota archaeon]MDP6530173.1 DNA polymerase I [Gemmatimonadota bacterium]MDP6802066.1 DNA polymerase I [Gemmatimonadota bacterium]MDP7032446.1 DNA polymerase I [Gemmatimonadota bacterium]